MIRVRIAFYGEVPEWSNGPDSKSGVRVSRTVGSNPTLSARKIKTAPLRGRFYFTCRVWLRMRALFDQRSSEAACWRGAREASESIPPSPLVLNQPKILFALVRFLLGKYLEDFFLWPLVIKLTPRNLMPANVYKGSTTNNDKSKHAERRGPMVTGPRYLLDDRRHEGPEIAGLSHSMNP